MAHEILNMRLLGHDTLRGFPNIGEGMAIQAVKGGQRVMWLAHEGAKDFTGVDVTDPRAISTIVQTDLQYEGQRSNSLAIVGDIMYVAHQMVRKGMPGAGLDLYNVADPLNPRHISTFDVTGEGSQGVHCLWCVDGAYVHMASSLPGMSPRSPRDAQFYVIVDVRDAAKPVQVGQYWFPGTMEGDAEPAPIVHEPNMGYGVHNTNVYPQRPDRAYCGFKDGGVAILDISDMSNIREVSRVDYNPPMPAPGFTHTALPLFERGLMIVTDETVLEHAEDWPKLAWVMDMSDETNPTTISTLPLPPVEEFRDRPGRFGAHNLHENQPVETSFVSEELIFGSYFSGGLRVHDITNPFQPKEVAYFIPELEEDPGIKPFYGDHAADGMNINDVYVDENRIVYAVDRARGGLYTLELLV
jgi:hypothetical protein